MITGLFLSYHIHFFYMGDPKKVIKLTNVSIYNLITRNKMKLLRVFL